MMLHLVFFLTLVLYTAINAVFSQQNTGLFIVPTEDQVYIYHNKLVPHGHGFNVYRMDKPGGEFIRITREPVRPASRIDEIRPLLGLRYDEVMRFFDANTASELWLKMRTEPFESAIATALFPEVASLLGRLYVDEEATMGNEVNYRIVFSDAFGTPTGETLVASAGLNPARLIAPTISRAENVNERVRLYWNYPVSDPARPDYVIRFYLFRKNDTGQHELLSEDLIIRNNAQEAHMFEFDSPVMNTTETWSMVAADFTGRQSTMGSPFTYELLYNIAPEAIMQVSANVVQENIVGIEWTMSEEPSVKGYNVYRGTDMSGEFTRLNPEPLETGINNYTDTTASGGVAYFYYITAVDNHGNESDPGSIGMAQVPDLLPPSMPSGFAAYYNPETETVDLSWEKEKYSDNFKSFVILRRREDDSDEGAFSRITPEILRLTAFADQGEAGVGFLEGTRYRYVLYAASRANNYSDTLSLWIDIPILTPPDPPVSFTAVNDNGFRVNLSWGASLSRNLAGYVIYRKGVQDEDFMELARLGLSDRFYRDEQALVPGSYYIYTATATDIAGNESAFATPDTLFFRNFNPPSSIRNLQAAARDTGIELQWEQVAATDLAGYRVYRATNPTGIYQPLNEELLTETHFFDPGGSPSSWYRVRAVDTSGNESRPGNPVRPVSMLD